MTPTASARHVSLFLAVAIVAVPVVFVWVLLRPGYAASTRRAAFAYAGVMTLVGFCGSAFG